nr:D-galactarate dehydratase [Rubellimicrobium arenae]
MAPPPAVEGIAVGEPAPTAVSATPRPAGQLGTTVASLGSPANPGLWLETPLVSEPTQGRVEYNGQSVALELRPSGGEPGSGSQISLEAMRALGAPLTGLPELTVFGG